MTEEGEGALSLLSLQAVSKSYWRGPRELRVLRGASLEVEAGTLVAVYGQRSSGKTALLELSAGFQQPDAGRVAFAGVDLATLSERELARAHREEIGWIAREGPHTAELTVAEYAALPLYRELSAGRARRRAMAALARYEVADCADERWDQLSDSARVRCAIAQAMVRAPRLLIADDPTAGLGLVDREQICALLRAAAEEDGLAVLMAVPDMPAMLHAHEVRMLTRGRLLAPARSGGTVVDFPDDRRYA